MRPPGTVPEDGSPWCRPGSLLQDHVVGHLLDAVTAIGLRWAPRTGPEVRGDAISLLLATSGRPPLPSDELALTPELHEVA